MHVGISLSGCWYKVFLPSWLVFPLARKWKVLDCKKAWTKTITNMRTTSDIFSYSEITGEVQFCCWTRKYQPTGCFHWPWFLLRSLLHFSLTVCAFLVGVIFPLWKQFPMQATGRTACKTSQDLFISPLFKSSKCLYTMCEYIECVLCIHELVCEYIIMCLLYSKNKAHLFTLQYINSYRLFNSV